MKWGIAGLKEGTEGLEDARQRRILLRKAYR